MSFRSRRRHDGWLQRLRSRFVSRHPDTGMLSDEQFQLAISKERSRAERRDLTFCIVSFDPSGQKRLTPAKLAGVTRAFRQRLRITDEIGEFQNSLGVLLPETIPSQAAQVANDLTDIAKDLDLILSTDIYAWPVLDDADPPNRKGQNGNGRKTSGQNARPGLAASASDQNSNGEKPGSSNYQAAVAVATQSQSALETGKPGVRVRPVSFSVPTPLWKRASDLAGSLSGLILLSPVFLITAIAIKVSSQGPVFFWQWREGQDGKLFRICKFRTMRTGAECEQNQYREMSEQDGPAFKIKDDPRLTFIGKFLRKSCIDELPQLINVLRGEMSLVGPRPLPAVESLDCSHWQRRRLDVLPGMTCIWQVQGGRDIPFDEWMRMDLDYIQQRGPVTDTVLLARTLMVTVLHRGSV